MNEKRRKDLNRALNLLATEEAARADYITIANAVRYTAA
jgi:hypothetical protein